MRIVIGKKEVHLVERDVKLARKLVTEFLNSVKNNAEEHDAPTLYMTTLIVMHLISKNQIDALTPESLRLLLEANYKGSQKKDA